MPRSPRSTLFPYTTLFRSAMRGYVPRTGNIHSIHNIMNVLAEFNPSQQTRSEEHTSELQSLAYLVCRLLLEKKKVTRREFRPTGLSYPASWSCATRTASWR